MSAALASYNVSLSATSSIFDYRPFREADAAVGWNASYTESDVWPVVPVNSSGLFIDAPPKGVAYRRTRFPGAAISLPFEGTALYLCFSAGDVSYSVTVDGAVAEASAFTPAAGTACQASGAETMFGASALTLDTHDVTLSVTGTPANDFRFFGGGFTMGVNTNGNAVDDSTIIDDQDSAWVMLPGRLPVASGWDTATNPALYRNSETFRCPYGQGNSASYTFIGASGVIVNGVVSKDSRAFSVTLDGERHNMDATSSWRDNATVFLAKGNLDPTVYHKLVLANFNTDKPNCTHQDDSGTPVDRYCCFGFDSVVLLQASSPSNTPSAPSSPTSGVDVPQNNSMGASSRKSLVGPIVGGVLGGLLFGVLVAGALVFVRRRRAVGSQFRPPTLYSGTPSMDQYEPTPWTGDVVPDSSYGASLPLADSTVHQNDHPVAQERPLKMADARQPSSSLPSAYPISPTAPPSPGSYGASDAPRLGNADVERVAALVAERMDAPPQYSG